MSNPSLPSTSLPATSNLPTSSLDRTAPAPVEHPVSGSPDSSMITVLMSSSPHSPSINSPNSASTPHIDLNSHIANIRVWMIWFIKMNSRRMARNRISYSSPATKSDFKFPYDWGPASCTLARIGSSITTPMCP
ncbi:hypothetical protein HAX54_039208 [Datura stramonium]|uniref:Uncharacterized protein n=1 Tax=Datura stramonium TaxID=4076 RepID=A0ABS8VM79_DATST|nr:hypothetical protein [Datura stramonium]